MNGRTPAGVWSHGTAMDIATPGVFGGETYNRRVDNGMLPRPMHTFLICVDDSLHSHLLELEEGWLFDPAFSNYVSRLLITIQSKGDVQYVDGQFDGSTGRVLAAQDAAREYEQTARIKFDSGEERSVPIMFVVPQEPTFSGQDVLVLGGNKKGQALVVRENPKGEDLVVVSSKAHPADIDNVPMKFVIPLHDEAGGS